MPRPGAHAPVLLNPRIFPVPFYLRNLRFQALRSYSRPTL